MFHPLAARLGDFLMAAVMPALVSIFRTVFFPACDACCGGGSVVPLVRGCVVVAVVGPYVKGGSEVWSAADDPWGSEWGEAVAELPLCEMVCRHNHGFNDA